MQIVLNRIPVREHKIIRSIISISGKPMILAFYSGNLFKSVTPLDIVLKEPTAKINSKL